MEADTSTEREDGQHGSEENTCTEKIQVSPIT